MFKEYSPRQTTLQAAKADKANMQDLAKKIGGKFIKSITSFSQKSAEGIVLPTPDQEVTIARVDDYIFQDPYSGTWQKLEASEFEKKYQPTTEEEN